MYSMVFHNLKRPTNSICEVVIVTEYQLSALKSDAICVRINESHLAGLSTAVCDPAIKAYIV